MDNAEIGKNHWDPKELLVAALLMFGGMFGSALILKLCSFVPKILATQYIGFIAVIAPILYLQSRYPLRLIDFGLRQMPNTIFLGIIAGLIASIGNIRYYFWVAGPGELKINNSEYATRDLGSFTVTVFVIFTILITPIVEEILFRGNIYRIIRNRYNVVWATIVTTIIWTLLHGRLDAIYTGFILIATYEFSKSLGPCIIAHMINNAIYCITIYTYAGT